jgi:transcriptional regulator with GAF, ATPase, and Fis domain
MDPHSGKTSMSSSNPTSNKIISIRPAPQSPFKDIVGQSPAMKKIFRMIEKVAGSDTTIMLNGETGTGKGMIARAIHECSPRRGKPLVQINCGATPEGLLESEFFGYRRGAFTGAVSDKPGKFELANGGTIFLDEIGDMSADLQVKVLPCWRRGSSSAWAAAKPSRWMRASSRRRTVTWKKRFRKASSGRISSIGCM